MKYIVFVVLLLAVILTGCGGGAAPGAPVSGTHNSAGPLDPQGNWLFQMNGDAGSKIEFAGQLFEINPPVVTGNPMGTAQLGYNCGAFTPNGAASGVDSITLKVTREGRPDTDSYTLTGTIAADQAHMSGTWKLDGGPQCSVKGLTGTWTARLLTAVDGTWTGTADNGLTLSATLREVTDQTSPTMGLLTGTITANGGGCFAAPVALTPEYNRNIHLGEQMNLASVPDSSGASLKSTPGQGRVDPDALTATGMQFTITGGKCDGQTFNVDLTRQK